MTIRDPALSAEAAALIDEISCVLTDAVRPHWDHQEDAHVCRCVAAQLAEMPPLDAVERVKALMTDDQLHRFDQLAGKLRSIIATDYDLSQLQELPTRGHPEGSPSSRHPEGSNDG